MSTAANNTSSSAISRRQFAGAVIASAALSMASCAPLHRYRFRLTFELNVDGRRVAGSGVWEEAARVVNAFPNGSMINSHLSGDGIPIDLGTRGTVFAMLVGYNERVDTKDLYVFPLSDWRPNAAFLPFMTGPIDPRTPESYGELQKLRSQTIELSLDALPAFASFRDQADPNSGFLIAARDFASSLGAGVELERATIEVTDNKITRGIEKALPWMAGRKRDLFGRGVSNWRAGQFTPYTPYFSR